jgi:hypothetical protein
MQSNPVDAYSQFLLIRGRSVRLKVYNLHMRFLL